ncbi:MAG: carbohydrate ABC transporter permease [Clostridia bacterium]|nr:carbohydrate ABC transporter permease [Clostridia bacterium]
MTAKLRKITGFDCFNVFWMLLFAIFCLIPLLIMFSGSFSTDSALQNYGFTLFPKEWSLLSYGIVFKDGLVLLRAYGISILVTAAGTALSIVLTALIAFPLSRNDFKFKTPITVLILITMLFSPGLVPTYILITQYLKWRNSLLALIIPGLGGSFYIILMRTFFADVPKEISDSAKIDGCSNFGIFLRIIMPLSTPALATCAVLFSLNYWNDWYSSFLYIESRELWSVQYLMIKLANEAQAWKMNASLAMGTESADSVVMATCIVGSLPVMIVFMFLQKYIVKGMMVGAVKG